MSTERLEQLFSGTTSARRVSMTPTAQIVIANAPAVMESARRHAANAALIADEIIRGLPKNPLVQMLSDGGVQK